MSDPGLRRSGISPRRSAACRRRMASASSRSVFAFLQTARARFFSAGVDLGESTTLRHSILALRSANSSFSFWFMAMTDFIEYDQRQHALENRNRPRRDQDRTDRARPVRAGGLPETGADT